jgi:chromosome segregation ATPase
VIASITELEEFKAQVAAQEQQLQAAGTEEGSKRRRLEAAESDMEELRERLAAVEVQKVELLAKMAARQRERNQGHGLLQLQDHKQQPLTGPLGATLSALSIQVGHGIGSERYRFVSESWLAM